ncbi:DUF2501 domain-containing protein [Acidomonas methanolica]|nr:DUF2501 domain-containing protein [Acidomonas methanolica]TCS30623.1 uncharacterized protein DUF2501 [Acidomonas methanolica]GBQ54149.1 hypothetical protein AA0498_2061 [Acidomonas methanolica]
MRKHFMSGALAGFALLAVPAVAQSIPGMGSVPGLGGLGGGGGMGGIAGSMLPSLASSSTGNIAGVLSYCVQNNVLNGGNTSSVLESLTTKEGVTSSGDYAAGQQGQLQTGGSNSFSLSSLAAPLKQKLCSMVLSRAQSLL